MQFALFNPEPPRVAATVVGDPDGLRPYQRDAVDAILRELHDHRSTLLVMATGLGKTQCFGALAKHWPGRVLILAHRDKLIDQARKRVEQMTGHWAGLEQAEWYAQSEKFVVSSIQTMSKAKRMGRFRKDDFGLVIADEAHHTVAPSWKRVLDYFDGAKVVGVTATPDRKDEKAMGQVFETVAYRREIDDGINDGYLVPFRVMRILVDEIKLADVRTTAGDLNQADQDAVMSTESVMHAVAKVAMEQAGDRATIIFGGPTVATAQRLVEVTNRYKPGSAYEINGKTDDDMRRQLYRAHKAGEYPYFVNVDVLTEGVDLPYADTMIDACQTKARSKYTQRAGRVLRPLEGLWEGNGAHLTADERKRLIAASAKPFALLIDLVGDSGRHELVSALDILGGNYDPIVVKRAKKKVEKHPGMLAKDALEQSKREIEAAAVAAAAKRAAVKAKVKYRVESVDPFRLMGMADRPDPRADGRLATAQQIEILTRNGFRPPAQGWSYDVASRLCSEIKVRLIKGLASPKMIKTLQYAHVDATHMAKGMAGELIGVLFQNKAAGLGWRFQPGQREQIMQMKEPGHYDE